MADEQRLYDEAFAQMATAPLEPDENPGPKRGGARPKVRPDDGRNGNGGARKRAGRPRGDNAASIVQISAEHQLMLDSIVAQRRSVQPTATRRGIVEGWIAESYAALEQMWQEAAEMISE